MLYMANPNNENNAQNRLTIIILKLIRVNGCFSSLIFVFFSFTFLLTFPISYTPSRPVSETNFVHFLYIVYLCIVQIDVDFITFIRYSFFLFALFTGPEKFIERLRSIIV